MSQRLKHLQLVNPSQTPSLSPDTQVPVHPQPLQSTVFSTVLTETWIRAEPIAFPRTCAHSLKLLMLLGLVTG